MEGLSETMKKFN